jgi:hypothetical protein
MPFRSSHLLLALASVPLVVACGYGDHHHGNGYYDGYYQNPPPSSGTIEQSTIDADSPLDIEAGAGAGVFVEYESGGVYHVTTSCDDAGQGACVWDVVVTALDGASVQSVSPVDLESDDSVSFSAGNQVRLVAYTDRDFDGFTLQTDPGAAIELDALLDDVPANRYMFWVGDGALHSGAPSNPVDLVPSAE